MNKRTLLIILALILVPAVLAANPGHTAGSISPGTFNTGGAFTFPQQLSVQGNFIIDTDTFFVNTTTSNIGIGTSTPTATLDINGTLQVSSNATINGTLMLGADPTQNLQAATKQYVDAQVGGTGDVGGNGTTNTIPLWSGFATLTDSIITQNSNEILVGGDFSVDTDTLFVDENWNRIGIRTTTPNAALEIDGGLRLNTEDTKPSCLSDQRGTMWYEQNSGATDDYLYSCMRNSTGAYNWILVARGG